MSFRQNLKTDCRVFHFQNQINKNEINTLITVFAAQNIVGAGVLVTQTELRHISLQGFCDEMGLLEEYATENEYTLYVAPCTTQHVNGQEFVRLDFIKEGIVIRK